MLLTCNRSNCGAVKATPKVTLFPEQAKIRGTVHREMRGGNYSAKQGGIYSKQSKYFYVPIYHWTRVSIGHN